MVSIRGRFLYEKYAVVGQIAKTNDALIDYARSVPEDKLRHHGIDISRVLVTPAVKSVQLNLGDLNQAA